jgi:hypothetical protein
MAMKPDMFGELMTAGLWIVVSILWLGYSVRMIVRGGSFGWVLSLMCVLTLGAWLYRAGRVIYRRYAQGKIPDVH